VILYSCFSPGFEKEGREGFRRSSALIYWGRQRFAMQGGQIIPQRLVESKILFIRGKKVMLDRDLAALYGVETKMLNRAVKRNTERFPEDFMFQLSKEEYTELLRCQFGTLERGRYSKYLPYAFTENGVAMLSSVLNSDRAI
jgi:hypothetical protein